MTRKLMYQTDIKSHDTTMSQFYMDFTERCDMFTPSNDVGVAYAKTF